MEQFASGWKGNYYGKGDVIVYRLHHVGQAPAGRSPVFGASVQLLTYGEAFWPTYTTGDNTGLIATDSMKNFIQRDSANFEGYGLEDYCRFLGAKFLDTYSQAEGVQVSASEIPFAGSEGGVAFVPSGPERAMARIELGRQGVLEAVSAIRGFKLLRLGGSAFRGFLRDGYTTLPDLPDRALHMWLDLEWRYVDPGAAFSDGRCTARVREIVLEVFRSFVSGSIQQMIYHLGNRLLAEIPSLAEVQLEAENRTWDTIIERGQQPGTYVDTAPPYGCLGVRLKR
jgi:urate oxidase